MLMSHIEFRRSNGKQLAQLKQNRAHIFEIKINRISNRWHFKCRVKRFCSPYRVYYAHFICNDKLLFYARNLANAINRIEIRRDTNECGKRRRSIMDQATVQNAIDSKCSRKNTTQSQCEDRTWPSEILNWLKQTVYFPVPIYFSQYAQWTISWASTRNCLYL